MTHKLSIPVLVCNIGWMDRYQGISQGDSITGGGRYIREKGYGEEIYNFLSHQGIVYGSVYPVPHEFINIQKLKGKPGEERVDGVTVIWCAKRPKVGGSYVVGLYRNASVYSEWQKPSAGSKRFIPGKKQECGFYVKAKAKDALCLDKDERILRVPRGIEGIGNSNIWFPEFTSLGQKFLKSASTLIRNGHISSPKRKFRKTKIGGWQSDIAKRGKIERLAMNAVAKWYATQGYDVSSVANQNLGWDLEAILKSGSKKSILKIEVKGLSKNEICVELTPNEFTHMQLHSETYRLCVVTNPQELSKQKIHRFGFSIETGKWHDQTGTVLSVVKKIGARCTV